MTAGQFPADATSGDDASDRRIAATKFEPSSVALPDELARMLPADTRDTWRKLAPHLPSSAYLAGGTALTVHLLHRVSRDLDIFLERREDLRSLWKQFQEIGDALATQHDDSTINGTIDGTRVQVLEATTLKIVAPFLEVGGLRVASVNDIMAMKLKVIVDGGELRDYFDIMKIEQDRRIMVETGLAFFLEKYSPEEPDRYVKAIVRALGYLDDVEDDPALPVSKQVISEYWQNRQRSLMRHLVMYGG